MFLLRSEWKYFYLVDSMLNSIWKDINGYVKTAIESGNLFFFLVIADLLVIVAFLVDFKKCLLHW